VTMIHPPSAGPAGPAARPPGDPGQPGGPGYSRDPGRGGGSRIAGIPITLTPGAYLLGVLAAGFGALTLPALDPGRSVAGYLAAAAGLVIVLLASMVAHELAHSIMARRYGLGVPVTIGLFGGVRHGRAQRPGSPGEPELPGPGAQLRVAAAGPLASLLLGVVSAAAAVALSALGAGLLVVTVAVAGAWINGLLAVANLVPGAGLDGGRIVRALAWARSGDSTRAGLIAARFGQVSGAILTAAGVTAVALGHLAGLWFGLIGLVMVAASRAEASQVRTSAALAGVRVRDILPLDGGLAPSARGWQTVQAFLDQQSPDEDGRNQLAHLGTTAYPVRDFDGQLSGLVTLTQLLAVPASHRADTRLAQVATPAGSLTFTTLDEPLTDLRTRLSVRPASPAALHTTGHALVLGPSGELAGLLTPADFARAAQFGALRASTAGAGAGPR
jgi:Zn-dependent protease/CBS domain-containing protein